MSSLWWSLRLRREAASVPLARRLLLSSMEAAGVDPDIAYDMSLALSEACANAVEHGTDTRGRAGAYRVSAYLEGNRCRIEVADTGPGFPTESEPMTGAGEAESGRGLFLIESLADHVRFRNRPGSRGAVVSFDKVLARPEGSLLTAS
ncbi:MULTISPECIES: ATP-binding protein [unclassified Streptomyces]|uniref:ATP-binding protein n=1 Tax=unclassified Streptomyces TaxID=2593676 RepID=UPI002DDA46F7|nr:MULTISPECIES: ATP-binding protein [unclassified Streptomyces]WSA93722.1 ATP-binding protein [Streptomyces sp. NBC_01795]WSB78094.1 ATP-binding protein [Streptomyces sp. NBC_01775]WSS13654.1 ATP-binding protein [Streptomyces sp. NBC_01186]WSS42449.1 ATP-binding protein [Streptomyces sp. NBC_01187]